MKLIHNKEWTAVTIYEIKSLSVDNNFGLQTHSSLEVNYVFKV